MSAHSAGAYTATLLVMVNVMKGGGCAPPHPYRPGLFLKVCGGCHTFYLFFLFQYMHSESHSYNDTIQSSIRLGLFLYFLIALVLSGEKKPPWGAEPRFELGPALQQSVSRFQEKDKRGEMITINDNIK